MPVTTDALYQQCLKIRFNDDLNFFLDCDLSAKEISELQLKINQNREKSRGDETVRLTRKDEKDRNIEAYCFLGKADEKIIFQECIKMKAGGQMVFRPDFDPELIKEKIPELFDKIKEGRKKPGIVVLFEDYNKIKAKCFLSPSK